MEQLLPKIDAAYALNHYIPACRTLEDVEQDFARLKYIKRLINSYKRGNDINERLLLNHFIIWFNTFEAEAARLMLFVDINQDDWDILIPFLVFLGYMPPIVPGTSVLTEDIEVDLTIVNKLKVL